ncbi:MAG TPA: polysaccharide deacetylase family protein [Candidatus Limnocylindrales bacterium]|jgi:peptidoglycan/xylan/chitin deacetylase (PgdA/CDA1 family)|nr:polysaccharide deacetylase family protein [Candidatus Limnocylindrales bacterium]
MEIDPGPQPPPRRGRSWASAAFAGLLGAALAVLVGVALVLPQLQLRFGAPGASPSPTGTAIPGSAGPEPSRTFVRPTPTPVPTPLTYFVKSGDSLNSIADEFGTTARSIAFWNRDRYPSLDPESEQYAPDRIGVGWTFSLIPNAVYDEDAEPSLPPTAASPSPAPSAGPATPFPTGPADVVSHGPRGTDEVALTLDMGGRLDPAVEIMDWLVDHRVKATIFPTGELGSTTEIGREVLRIVRDHPDLFELGNHSWDHPSFTELTAAQMADQLWRTEEAIATLGGQSTRPWFRPPFGAWTRAVRDGVGAAGWRSLVMWDIDTIDWRPASEGGPTATDIEAKVLANAQGGSIVLMHLGGWHTLEALPGIADGLAEKGLRAVTLEEMLGG